MSKILVEVTTTSIAIENLVGTKGVDPFPAQVRIFLAYSNWEDGAPCKVQFKSSDPDSQGCEFNGLFSHHDGNVAVVIRNEDDTAMMLVVPIPIAKDFKKSGDVSEGALVA